MSRASKNNEGLHSLSLSYLAENLDYDFDRKTRIRSWGFKSLISLFDALHKYLCVLTRTRAGPYRRYGRNKLQVRKVPSG